MATLTFFPASGAIASVDTVVRVTVEGADTNDTDASEKRYTLLFENPDGDDARSYVFNVSADGDHEFNSFIFPNAGTWDVSLVDEEASEVVSASVVVS